MASLKKNLNNISDDTKILAEDYLKLFSRKFSEKLALMLGIIASVFLLFTLILTLGIFFSFALSGLLNKVLPGQYLGFWIVSACYVLIIGIYIVRIFKTKTPLFSNLFVKLLVQVMNIDLEQSKNIKGLKKDQEQVRHRIEADKTKIEADWQILKHAFLGNILKELLSVFVPKKKESGSSSQDKKKSGKKKTAAKTKAAGDDKEDPNENRD